MLKLCECYICRSWTEKLNDLIYEFLAQQSFALLDIDECQNPGACSQICLNEKGSFKCECEDGYLRDPHDLTRCKATEGHASLLFARRHDIRKISLDHHEMTSIVNDTKQATAIDFVFRTGMIFWNDASESKIYKSVNYLL